MANPFDQYDEKPASRAANPFDRYDAKEQDTPGTLASLGAGLGQRFGELALKAQGVVGKGLQKVGATTAGDWLVDDADAGRAKLAAELAPYKNAHPTAAGIGRVGTDVLATLPVGGVLAQGLSRVPALASGAAPLLNAIRSSGFTTGAPAASTLAGRAASLGVRAAGGAITGGAATALLDPDNVVSGAAIGAALPPALAGTGRVMGYLGKGAYSLAQPFTREGQERLAGSVLNKFAKDGPADLDLAEYIAGSTPTLAEATGNAGLARLQSVVRDLRPNLFAERETVNSAARDAAFDGIAGSKAARDAAIEARDEAAKPLYGQAFSADAMRQDLANSAQQMRSPFSGVGLSGARDDLATPGLRDLMSRPMFRQAAGEAKRLAADNGVHLDDPLQSLQGLHYIKLALDDALNPGSASALGRNASNAVMGMRDKLTQELAEISPLYGNARQTFAEMSQPVNAMEALQGLNIRDARGNITLGKVQSAIMLLNRQRAKPGVDAAKAITDEQMGTLTALRDDLIRQSRTSAGKSAGSNTLQNIATDNIISSLLPGKAAEVVGNKAGHFIGQMGRLAYSGPNEAVRNRMVELMLDPTAAKGAMDLAATPALQRAAWPNVSAATDLSLPALQLLYRAGPPLSSSR